MLTLLTSFLDVEERNEEANLEATRYIAGNGHWVQRERESDAFRFRFLLVRV